MGVLVFDPTEGLCLYANKMAREILEIGAGEGHFMLYTMVPDVIKGGHLKTFNADLMQNQGFFNDILVRKCDGNTIVANVGLKQLNFEGFVPKRMLVVMVQDVTFQKKLQREIQAKQEEIRKAYAELLEQNRQLKELDRAKDRFIALTTHELRTPLSAIVATAEVLALGLHESDEQRQDFIKSILDQGNQLMELINDILDFAKIRAGKMDYFVEFVSLGPVIQKTLAQYKNMAEQYDVQTTYETPDAQIEAFVDTLRLREILNNVVSNAIKYNRPGGLVRVSASNPYDITENKVADTGHGISEESKSSVFNEFETTSVATHHKGTGLGMPISKQLAEAMGGKIWFEIQVGQGTTFYITIPRQKVLNEE